MSHPGRLLLVLSIVVAMGALAPPAWAQDDDDAPEVPDTDAPDEPAPPDNPEAKKEAGKFLKAGDSLIKKGDRYAKRKRTDKANQYYERALEAYQRAFDIYPKPQLYWLIALAEQKLGRNLDALRHYQQLVKEVPDMNDALKTQVGLQVDEAKQHVSTLTFVVMPEGATISVDGEDIGTAPYQDPLYLEPGEHTIAVTAEGHTPHEETVTLEAGAESERTIGLDKIPVVVKKPQPRRRTRRPPVEGPSKTPLIIGISATGAFGALATVTGLLAVSKHGTFSDESKPQDERDSAASSGKTYALITDLMWVGAIGAGAYTAYYYYKVYRPKSREADEERERRRRIVDRKLWITPYVAGSGGGVAVGGRF